MKKLRVCLGLCFLISCSFASLDAVAAENGYLDNDGKMELKTDRLEETDAEKAASDEAAAKETVLDKLGIPLFTDKLDREISQKKESGTRCVSEDEGSAVYG
ncbi:type VII secretion protein EssA [Listeria floridensis]|uniref:type VII secretion protein EssA n=1 Tax=Listeria floridensis TaxID=1494962 RepID=UPI00068EA304|nr:type VII secretion protein EssA [Listeria floridensis]